MSNRTEPLGFERCYEDVTQPYCELTAGVDVGEDKCSAPMYNLPGEEAGCSSVGGDGSVCCETGSQTLLTCDELFVVPSRRNLRELQGASDRGSLQLAPTTFSLTPRVLPAEFDDVATGSSDIEPGSRSAYFAAVGAMFVFIIVTGLWLVRRKRNQKRIEYASQTKTVDVTYGGSRDSSHPDPRDFSTHSIPFD